MNKYFLLALLAVSLPACTTVVEPAAPPRATTTSVTRESQTTISPYSGAQRTDTTTTIQR